MTCEHINVTLNGRLLSRMARCSIGVLLLGTCLAQIPIIGRSKDHGEYGMGLIINVPLPEAELSQVVADVSQNGIIRGSKEYNKDEYITGAQAATSSPLFPAWTEGGKVFYKVKKQTLDPRNFKDSSDVGTLAVRYVVQPQAEKNSILHIDAIYVEDFRKTVHLSNGSVESSEYKDIQDRIAAIELMRKETIEAEREKQEARDRGSNVMPTESFPSSSSVDRPAESPAAALEPGQSLEEHIHQLRGQVERAVKSPGAPLKAAPFQTAATLKSLPSGAEVLLVILTPYWCGVETHEGEHGWILREQLEPVK